ncbi:hypothetical protein KGF57_004089 [Candida theae]|uniref:TEA domain-containing protein n=1 Tax=Candida theae TaxID=1198502 RepID=A0AAD5FX55_9ASCO|nr:uncharacterized protein KGF57_004089 [Candida theae]KAI5952993.1 hypothetical protein KGF57_004089 [Candida theae]
MSYKVGFSQKSQQDLLDQELSAKGNTALTATAIEHENTALFHEQQQQQQPDDYSKRRKLPIIVDVALDANGKQLYQIHESSKLVRKEMPRSTNFNLHSELTAEQLSFIQNGGDFTDISTSPLKEGTSGSKSFHQDDYYTHSSNDHDVSFFNEGNASVDSVSNTHTNPDLSHTNKLNHEGFSRVEDTDIWSEDVEQAFEEVLTFIPKNGLNKIKIAGRSCGRNELISDYIFTKTGKFRTRKQVSSHIQVIKNLKQNDKIIDLINNGPNVANDQDQAQILKKFETVFSKINISKSLGFSNSMKRKSSGNGCATTRGRSGGVASQIVPIHLPATKRRRKSHTSSSSSTDLPELEIGNFSMSITDCNSEPILLTIEKNSFNKYGILKHLKLNDNASISHRFPGMAEFENCPQIPVLHNMARIYLPDEFSPKLYDVGSGFHASYNLKCKNHAQSLSTSSPTTTTTTTTAPAPTLLTTKLKSKQFSIFTCIYSYGQQVSKYNQSGIHLNEECQFLSNFWKPFTRFVLMGKSAQEVATALRGLSIKQVVYESHHSSSCGSDHDQDDSAFVKDEESFVVLKSRVKLVLLWEFSQVYDPVQAITTTTKIILPGGVNNDHLVTADEKIVPQVVTYNVANDESYQYQNVDAVDYDMESAVQTGPSAISNFKIGKATTSPNTTSISTSGLDHCEGVTAATTVTTAAQSRSKGLPSLHGEFGPEPQNVRQFFVGDAYSQQQQLLQQQQHVFDTEATLSNQSHPFHHVSQQQSSFSYSHIHPDYEIQMQPQIPVHYHHVHPHSGYKLHQSAHMDLMMVPTGSVHLEPVSNFQEYQYANQGFTQGYTSDY